MTMKFRALVVDDDPDASAWLAYRLNERFPELEIVCRESPDLSGEFDLYFIDNDFHGKSLAADLAAAIRAINPPALIVAFSARLDNKTLKLLVNAGCDGACEKTESQDVELMMRIVSAHLNRRRCETEEPSSPFAVCCVNGTGGWMADAAANSVRLRRLKLRLHRKAKDDATTSPLLLRRHRQFAGKHQGSALSGQSLTY